MQTFSIFAFLIPVLFLMLLHDYLPWLLPTLGAFLIICVLTRKLTISAAVTAAIIGLSVLLGAGFSAACMLLTFFGLSVLATSHKKTLKAEIHPESVNETGRSAAQVFANGGVAGILSLLTIVFPIHSDLFLLMLAGSLASALADTLSSELGVVYGHRSFNIITFKKEAKGLDGVISIEGTLIGIAGALIIAMIYSLDLRRILIVAVAGTLGNIIDSILGSLLERKHLLGNNMVNFLNTLFAAVIAWAIYTVPIFSSN